MSAARLLSPARAALACGSSGVVAAAAALGHRVRIDPNLLDRSAELALKRPGLWSANRSCRMMRAADAWLAVNLPRLEDRELVAAWLRLPRPPADPWASVVAAARGSSATDLLAQARLLGLPVAIVGEMKAGEAPIAAYRLGTPEPRGLPPRVVDLSSLWAGPLCAALLAEAGAQVTRYESVTRPDPSRTTALRFFSQLNARKAQVVLDFSVTSDRAALGTAMAEADVVVTSARPRAFAGLGLTPEAIFARNPKLIWVAITGHGWFGDGADRVGLGDDAAAAGGLLRWTPAGRPGFVGDALADPLTGLAAAAAALQALGAGGGVLLDAAMSRVAADAASHVRVKVSGNLHTP